MQLYYHYFYTYRNSYVKWNILNKRIVFNAFRLESNMKNDAVCINIKIEKIKLCVKMVRFALKIADVHVI